MNVQQIIDMLFVPQCGSCNTPGLGVCETCVPPAPPMLRDLPTLRVRAVGEYSGALKRCILALKNGRRDVARALAFRAAPLVPRGSTIVPVPTTMLRRWERGFDGCDLLARTIVAVQPEHAMVASLHQTRGDRQRGRGRSARLAARGRFRWRGEALCGRKVVLLDDVVTTGATLEDCAAVLRRAGATIDCAVAIALTPKELLS